MDSIGIRPGSIFSFGKFRLDRERRLLKHDNTCVRISGRPFDLLVALVENHGHVLAHRQLIEKAWSHVAIEDSNLRVNIATLRKILGDGVHGARYIANIPGRGYSFVAPVAVDTNNVVEVDANEVTLSFGSFQLYPAQKLLMDGPRRIPIGSRAIDILIMLAKHAGKLVATDSLLEQVWPNSVVDQNSVRVHMSALRKILLQGKVTAIGEPIVNVPGQGYRLAMNVLAVRSDEIRSAHEGKAYCSISAHPRFDVPRSRYLPAIFTEIK